MAGPSNDFWNQNRRRACEEVPSECFKWPHRPASRETDPLRQLNRCCDPTCCIERSLPRPSHLYSCSAINNLDSLSASRYEPYDVQHCQLKNEEWCSASAIRGKNSENWANLSFAERDRQSALLRQNYQEEIEILRAKLNLLKKSATEGKRSRQRCESEPGFPSVMQQKMSKRSCELPPTSQHSMRLPRATCRSPPTLRSNFKRETRSMPPRLPSRSENRQTKCAFLPAIPSRRSVEEYQNDSICSDDSACENLSGSDEALDNISEDDVSVPSSSSQSSLGKRTNAEASPVAPPSSALSAHSFRPSLFSNVPPYLRFATHEEKGPPLPQDVAKILKWRLSTITPVVIRRTLTNSGFKFVRKSNDWVGQWGKHMNSFLFKTLKDFQKLNHFPGTFHIGRKDKLWKNLNRLMIKFGKKEFGFIPTTYILPQDHKSLRIAWEKSAGKGQWIVKPPAAARGTGIRVVYRWSDIPKNKPLIVQKYISQPYLINGSKFDLRLYVLVTSIHPLRIYLYDDGLVRFASVKYSSNVESLSDRFMHLTNYSINKMSNQYCANEDASSCQGHKWTLKSLWVYLKKEGINVAAIQRNLTDLVIKTIISGESHIQALAKNNLPSRYCSYELFGIDVLLDANLRPWLLEVNISPSLHSSSPLDLAVKGPLVSELFNIAGFQVPAKLSKESETSYLGECGLSEDTQRFCYDKRLYTTILSRDERIKHTSFCIMSRDEYKRSILEKLTSDDLRHLIQYEDELTQLKRFEKVFPTTDTHAYRQYFDSPRYYNMLFDAWEEKYGDDRAAGINLLKTLCLTNLHLEVPFAGSKTKSSANPSQQQGAESDTEAPSNHEIARSPLKRRRRLVPGRPGVRVSPLQRKIRPRPVVDTIQDCRNMEPTIVRTPPVTIAANS